MKLKALLLTAALAAGSTGTAMAQVNGIAMDGITGDLFLTVFDPNRSETFNVDLGVDMVTYLSNPTGFAANAGLTAWLSGASDPSAILFDVAADNFEPDQLSAGTFGSIVTAIGQPNAPANFADYNALSVPMQNYVAGVNQSINNTGGIDTGGAGYFADGFTWNRNVGQGLGGTITGGSIGTPITLWSILADGSDPNGETYIVSAVAELTLSANGSIAIGSAPVVPIPAAGWLLTSAFAGLVGVARRRSAAKS